MEVRRDIGEAEAVRLIRDAQRTSQPITGVIFPMLDYRARRLQGVSFIDCDVGRLAFGGPLLRQIELTDCSFIDCDGPHHVRYRKVTFSRCRWQGGRLSGVFKSSAIRGCRMTAVRVDELSIDDCELEEIDFTGLTGRGLTVQDCTLRRAEVSGRLEHVNLTGIRVRDLDISALWVSDGGLLGIKGEGRLPDFDDSFVVSADSVTRLIPTLRGLVRPEVRDALPGLVSDGFELEWFDPSRLAVVPGDGFPPLLPGEQRDVLRLLWEHRARALPV